MSPGGRIEICDVGPRDGLQNESRILSAGRRAELCNRLADVGVPRVEAVSFVNPERVPAMAGAEEVMAAFPPRDGLIRAGLVLNERGYERALESGVEEIHYAFPTTETMCERNQGTSVEAALQAGLRLTERARADGREITITIATAFGCPFEGRVDPARVIELAAAVQAAQPKEIVLADTIGVGVPSQVRELVGALLDLGARVGAHLHNTRNTGYANAMAAVEAGVHMLDASCGGIGGCPFAPRATGNIATEDLLYLLHGSGYETGIDPVGLREVSSWLAELMDKELPGQTYKSGGFEPVAA